MSSEHPYRPNAQDSPRAEARPPAGLGVIGGLSIAFGVLAALPAIFFFFGACYVFISASSAADGQGDSEGVILGLTSVAAAVCGIIVTVRIGLTGLALQRGEPDSPLRAHRTGVDVLRMVAAVEAVFALAGVFVRPVLFALLMSMWFAVPATIVAALLWASGKADVPT